MLLRASLLLSLALGALACGTPKGGKLVVDTPALPYKAPDIEELTGISEDEPVPAPPADPKPEAKVETPTPAPATPAAPPAKPTATKAGTPAAPAKK